MKINRISQQEYRRRPAMAVSYGFTDTPVGEALIAWCAEGICFIGFVTDSFDREELSKDFYGRWPGAVLSEDAARAGELAAIIFDPAQKRYGELSVLFKGTPFQIKVWEELLKIPFGQKASYSQVAAAAGHPEAVRAAASAVGRNDISYLVPCHRVVRLDDSIGGYYWGLPCKRIILLWERQNA